MPTQGITLTDTLLYEANDVKEPSQPIPADPSLH
jgi:hypothetical protein